VRNAGLNLLGHGLPILVALGTMPVVVRGLGPAQFGLLALAWTVVGYAGTFDLGLGRAATKRVSEAVWQRQPARVGRIASTVALAQGGIGLFTGGLLWLLAPWLAGVLVAGAGPGGEAAVVLRVLAAALPAVLLSNALRAVLEGIHRFDLVNAARAPAAAAIFLAPFAGVLLGWSLVVIVAVLAATRYAAAGLFLLLYWRAAPGRAWTHADASELGGLLRFGGWIALSNLVVPLVFYLERLVVTALRGPIALAYYAAPHELVSKLHLIPGAVAVVLFPAFSGLAGDPPALLRQVRQGLRLILLLLAPPLAVLLIVAAPLLGIWLGPDYGERSATVMQLLAFALLLNGVAYVAFTLLEGIGRPRVVALYHLVELPFYAVLLWLLVTRWGIVGAAAAWTVRLIVDTPVFFVLAVRAAGLSAAAVLAGSVGRTLASALLLHAAAAALALLITGATGLIVAAVGATAAFAVLGWFRLLEPADRTMMTTIVDRFRPRG
jgi:O-antigen/teichoic acid export membrane protein